MSWPPTGQIIAGFHAGSTAYKVLYRSTGYDGSPTAVSGFIVVPDGASEAMNALDSVRAARNLAAAHAGSDFVVWGHSQGGQASLFTEQLASVYAPELHLVGSPPAHRYPI